MASVDKEKIKAEARIKQKQAKEKAAIAKRQQNKSYFEAPEPTGDPEIDCEADLNALQKGFRDAIKREDKRFELATDSEYWFCVCFQTREQKEFLLKALELFEEGDKYLDGQVVAEKLGIKLPKADVPYRTEGKIDKAYLEFVD
ncbi:hypothetical protein [Caviibacterium pharyngocola]|uniref:Uncharacterized protein n=1 Tax=Caviibacterium pharyngocola TaxID=28159 RepID=A0A2M8RUW4_9PAST|nr:hypothetical protein [Caviibacterium pharyngocola]PJG82686.1 hypothetical protein CVP04_07735 [Caviibacterium pharyngocola]